ncbi:hypothetical protein ACIP2X_03615 [Streptomyces sp. NPDC089424]|uniref:hypothetical protein n=1 Tax=Streptomyces sp. NPDC089424 TaxID=3365917 RepID=UPI00380D57A8
MARVRPVGLACGYGVAGEPTGPPGSARAVTRVANGRGVPGAEVALAGLLHRAPRTVARVRPVGLACGYGVAGERTGPPGTTVRGARAGSFAGQVT